MPGNVSCWEVFYLFCKHTKPNPKNKFVVNSHVNEFVKNRPQLMQCEVKILQQDHAFLSYDSYVDCRDIFGFHLNELTDRRGEIAVAARPLIRAAVASCPVLPRKYKEMIALENSDDTDDAEE